MAMAQHFFPRIRKGVGRHGITLHGGLRYMDPSLTSLIGRPHKIDIMWDPRDVTRIYVRVAEGAAIQEVPLIRPSLRRMSVWEWRRIRTRRPLTEADLRILDAGIEHADARVRASKTETRKARKREAVEQEGRRAFDALHAPGPPAMAAPNPVDDIDLGRPVRPSEVEIWEE
jgi:hypothetical protein